MKCVNIAELKNRLSSYLNDVRTGEEILVRDRQTPIARILPIGHRAGDDDELRALAVQGKVRIGERPLDKSFWDLPAPRVPRHLVKRALDGERDEG